VGVERLRAGAVAVAKGGAGSNADVVAVRARLPARMRVQVVLGERPRAGACVVAKGVVRMRVRAVVRARMRARVRVARPRLRFTRASASPPRGFSAVCGGALQLHPS
jgi:hypothetical protein